MAITYQPFDLGAEAAGEAASNPPFVQTFNNTSSWAVSGDQYVITFSAATHEKGIDPQVQVFENVAGEFEEVMVAIVVDTLGNVNIKVSQTPDLRFQGKVNIVGDL